jgi:hypothetical protein
MVGVVVASPVILGDAYGDLVAIREGNDSVAGDASGFLIHAHDGYSDKIRVLETIPDSGINRLAVQASLAPGTSVIVGSPIPENLGDYVVGRLRRGGGLGDDNMIVDASVTPVEFIFPAPAADDGYDVSVGEVRIVITTQDITFDGASFGGKPALINGLIIDIIAEDEQVIVISVKFNEDFLFFPSTNGLVLNNTGPKDAMVASINLGGAPTLVRGSADKVRITVQDNLTGGGANEFNYFKAQFYGEKINN